jgi:hypothetical protein
VLQRHEHRAAPFAAEAQTLQEPQRREQHCGPQADRGVCRQQPDGKRGEPHDQQRDHEDVLAPDLVAVVAEHDAAEWPCDEADGVRRERQQGADQRLEARKEQLVEDERRRGAEP